jgi:MerR family transcriptional regulator, repressor of the yfmOP operon
MRSAAGICMFGHNLMNNENDNNIRQIGEIAKSVDMSQRTIRYYEEIGLMNSVRRIEGGKRVYTDDDVRRLKLIKRLKVLGLTLSEMHELEAIWSIHRSNDFVLTRLLEIFDSHLNRIEDRIADLNILKNEIIEYRERINAKLGKG